MLTSSTPAPRAPQLHYADARWWHIEHDGSRDRRDDRADQQCQFGPCRRQPGDAQESRRRRHYDRHESWRRPRRQRRRATQPRRRQHLRRQHYGRRRHPLGHRRDHAKPRERDRRHIDRQRQWIDDRSDAAGRHQWWHDSRWHVAGRYWQARDVGPGPKQRRPYRGSGSRFVGRPTECLRAAVAGRHGSEPLCHFGDWHLRTGAVRHHQLQRPTYGQRSVLSFGTPGIYVHAQSRHAGQSVSQCRQRF